MGALDEALARHAEKWMKLSRPKLRDRIDLWVAKFDPALVRYGSFRVEKGFTAAADLICTERPSAPDSPPSRRGNSTRTASRWNQGT